MRRPSGAPAAVVLLLGLARDLLGGWPVGLGALTLVAATETLRMIADPLRRRARIYEFLVIACLAAAMAMAQIAALTLALAAPPTLEMAGLRVLMTTAAYLVVFFVFRQVMRIRAEPPPSRFLGRAEP